jgi:hypothetical protein
MSTGLISKIRRMLGQPSLGENEKLHLYLIRLDRLEIDVSFILSYLCSCQSHFNSVGQELSPNAIKDGDWRPRPEASTLRRRIQV